MITAGLAFPKQRPIELDKRDRAKAQRTIDARERAKCHARSGGRCEVVILCLVGYDCDGLPHFDEFCCNRPASENHHLLGGMGRRNRGPSILAEHRLDCCREHHREITRNVLQPSGAGRDWAATVRYERVR